jgi:hypothetical protein
MVDLIYGYFAAAYRQAHSRDAVDSLGASSATEWGYRLILSTHEHDQ